MNKQEVELRLKEIEAIKYTYCYNKERVINKPNNFCLSVFYEEWLLRVKQREFINKL
jgi:hypothetical protein